MIMKSYRIQEPSEPNFCLEVVADVADDLGDIKFYHIAIGEDLETANGFSLNRDEVRELIQVLQEILG